MTKYIKLDDLMKFPIRLDHYDKEHGNEVFVLGIESVLEYAENLPTADVVERKRGEWVLEHETWGKLQCSNCKKEALLEKAEGDVGTILLYVTSNLCPHCGADMRGESE